MSNFKKPTLQTQQSLG